MEVANSEHEQTPKHRKRQRDQATAAEEEQDTVPVPTRRGRRRSQSSASPEDTTYSGPQNQTERDAAQDAAPTSPHHD